MALEHRVEEVKLKNGAKGLFIYVPNTTVVLYDIHFRAGTLHAPKLISQVAHVMEHMAFGPNAKHKSLEEFSHVFKKNGAYHNAWTSSSSMVYRAYSALMEWGRILELEGLSVSQPKFVADNFKAEKGNVKEELIGYANNHNRVLWQEVMKAAGVNRWYDSGELSTVDNIKLEDVRRFHKNTHTFKNMQFVLAGDLEPHRDKAIAMIESWPLPAGRRLLVKKEIFQPAEPVLVFRPDLGSLSFFFQFSLNRELERSEMTAMTTLNHILTATFHSRIYGKARAKGICYGMGSSYNTGATGVAEWSFSGDVSATNATELFELIVKELRNVMKGQLTKAEIEEAKGFRLGALQMAGQTVADFSSWYGDMYFDSGKIDHMRDMPDRIKAVQAEDMARLAREFIEDGVINFGVAGNCDQALVNNLYAITESVKDKKAIA